MARHVAFLRGINVGGHRVKMDDLRASFEALGFRDVSTFIASGNVVFDGGRAAASTLERRIERHLERELGYGVPTFLRTFTELSAIAEVPPFEPEEIAHPAWSLHVMFLSGQAGPSARRALSALESERDEFRFAGREAYWLTRGRMSESPLFAGDLARATADLPHTMRSIKTVRKLLARYT